MSSPAGDCYPSPVGQTTCSADSGQATFYCTNLYDVSGDGVVKPTDFAKIEVVMVLTNFTVVDLQAMFPTQRAKYGEGFRKAASVSLEIPLPQISVAFTNSHTAQGRRLAEVPDLQESTTLGADLTAFFQRRLAAVPDLQVVITITVPTVQAAAVAQTIQVKLPTPASAAAAFLPTVAASLAELPAIEAAKAKAAALAAGKTPAQAQAAATAAAATALLGVSGENVATIAAGVSITQGIATAAPVSLNVEAFNKKEVKRLSKKCKDKKDYCPLVTTDAVKGKCENYCAKPLDSRTGLPKDSNLKCIAARKVKKNCKAKCKKRCRAFLLSPYSLVAASGR